MQAKPLIKYFRKKIFLARINYSFQHDVSFTPLFRPVTRKGIEIERIKLIQRQLYNIIFINLHCLVSVSEKRPKIWRKIDTKYMW